MVIDRILGASDAWAAWVVAVTWQLAVLAVVAWVCERVLRLRQPGARYGLWWFVLAAPLVLAPTRMALERREAVVRVAPPAVVEQAVTRVRVPVMMPVANGTPEVAATRALVPDSPWWSRVRPVDVLAIAWVMGCLMLVARLVVGYARARRLVGESRAVADGEDLGVLAELCAEAGVSWEVGLRVSSSVGAPVLYGVRRPTILLPEDWVETLAADDLRALLAHEVAHVRRGDCLANLVQRLGEIPAFFHPGVWLASRQVTLAREELADGWALARGVEASSYARSLAAVAERTQAKLGAVSVGVAEGKSTLLRRVEAIMDMGRRQRVGIGALIALGILMLMISVSLAAVQLGAAPGELSRLLPDPAEPNPAWGTASDGEAGESSSKQPWIEVTTYDVPYAHHLRLRLEFCKKDGSRSNIRQVRIDVAAGRHTVRASAYEDSGDVFLDVAVDDEVQPKLIRLSIAGQWTCGTIGRPDLGDGGEVSIAAIAWDEAQVPSWGSEDTMAEICNRYQSVLVLFAEVRADTTSTSTPEGRENTVYAVIDLQFMDATYIAWLFGKAELPKGFFVSSGSPEMGEQPQPPDGGAKSGGALKNFLPEGIKTLIPAAFGSRQLVVAGTPQAIAELRELVDLIDRKPQQVMLECQYFAGLPANVDTSDLRTVQGGEHGLAFIPWPHDWDDVRPPAGVEPGSCRVATMNLLPGIVVLPSADPSGQVLLVATPVIHGDATVTVYVEVREMENDSLRGEGEALTATSTRRTQAAVNVRDGEAFGLLVSVGDAWETVIVTPRIVPEERTED